MKNSQLEQKHKRFWQSLEEKQQLQASDWKRAEFPESAIEVRESDRKKGVSRRDFLKIMGAGAVMASAACRRPTEQIVPAVINPAESTPGTPVYYSSSAPDGTGIIVKTRESRPIHIAGNPDHPLSGGGVSASVSASLMDLYDPDRLRKAVLIDRKSGSKKAADESALTNDARKRLEQGDYVLLTGPIDGPSSRALLGDFLRRFPGGRHVELRPDPTLRQIAEGQRAAYGDALVPYYRLDRADLVVAIDGDFLGTMIQPTYFSRAFAKKRELRRGQTNMNRLVAFESMYSLTGSNADERHPIRPGDQALIALALAAQIVVVKGRTGGPGGARALLEQYTPASIADRLKSEDVLYKKGSFEKTIERIADELWNARGRSLVLGGSPLAATGANAAGQIAINLLNSILENDGKTVDHGAAVRLSPGASDSELQTLLAEISAGKVKTLVLAANPVYHLPASLNVKAALEKSPYTLALTDRIDESASLADAALPLSHYLEAWGDSEVIEGVLSIQQPVIRPLYKTLSFEDRLIQIAGGELGGAKNFYEYIRARWQTVAGGRNFSRFWNSALQAGYAATGAAGLNQTRTARGFRGESLQKLPLLSGPAGSSEGNRLIVGLYYNVQVLDGALANNAYRQELPEPVTKIVWDNYVVMLPATARRLGLKQADEVEVKTATGSLRLPVHLQPGVHPQAALIALGYGRTAAGKAANEVGQNALVLAGRGSDSFTFAGIAAEVTPTGERLRLASTQTIYRDTFNEEEKAPFTPPGVHQVPYGGSAQHDRPILRETTLAEYKTGTFKLKPDALYFPEASLMQPWNYKDTRWHMTVDLNLCTGCGACVTSCNTENNIPMVGKDQVMRGREMHWMRIDRYFAGEEENPEAAHQPMLCQHCENAPCENVCPVAATSHNSEGLNVMTYNRCVGTRYCSNNCPYKVRRFNWYENWYYWEGFIRNLRDPQHLAFNPDVTVRTRGVIEKCTFCIHRIAAARHESRARGESYVPDGSVVTACQEVCPSSAITFGNIYDKNGKLGKLVAREAKKRGYQVLDYLGVKPSITYLAKVRNRSESV